MLLGGSRAVPHWCSFYLVPYPGNVKLDHGLSVSSLHVTEPRKFDLKVLEGRQALDIKGRIVSFTKQMTQLTSEPVGSEESLSWRTV
jgi:hypothetical protein